MVKNNYHEVGIINFKYYNIYLLKNNNYTYILKKLLKKNLCAIFGCTWSGSLFTANIFFFKRQKLQLIIKNTLFCTSHSPTYIKYHKNMLVGTCLCVLVHAGHRFCLITTKQNN